MVKKISNKAALIEEKKTENIVVLFFCLQENMAVLYNICVLILM
jgi:hypothetical protein